MKALNHYLSQRPFRSICIIACCITIVIGVADHLVGAEVSTTIMYFIPITIAAWYGSRSLGLAISLLATFIWLITDVTSGAEYSHMAIYGWNTLMRLGIFVFITILLSRLHDILNLEEIAADTDALTGALNVRGFRERLAEEYARSMRSGRPFSLAFIDIDDFKKINDTFGHSVGDILLSTVANTINSNLRQTDHLARMGGDEFVILFSETNEDIVHAAFTHVHKRLMEIINMHNWPVTLSVGVVSFGTLPESPSRIIKIADDIMYSVKKSTKNNVVYKTWSSPEK